MRPAPVAIDNARHVDIAHLPGRAVAIHRDGAISGERDIGLTAVANEFIHQLTVQQLACIGNPRAAQGHTAAAGVRRRIVVARFTAVQPQHANVIAPREQAHKAMLGGRAVCVGCHGRAPADSRIP